MLGPLLRLLRAKERTIEAAYQRGYAAGQDWTMSRAVEERAHGVALGREMERAEVERLRALVVRRAESWEAEGRQKMGYAAEADGRVMVEHYRRLAEQRAMVARALRALLDGEGGGDAKR